VTPTGSPSSNTGFAFASSGMAPQMKVADWAAVSVLPVRTVEWNRVQRC
jgi:hypothetical protein